MTARSGTHQCPGFCGRQVPRHHFSCRNCWYRLPPDLRRPISATYQRDHAGHLQAMGDAERWYRENTTPAAGVSRGHQ